VDDGFTIVEVLVLMAVVAVTVGAVVPYIRPSKSAVSLNTVAQTLAADLRTRRNKAIATRSDQVAILDTASRALLAGAMSVTLPDGATVSLTAIRQSGLEGASPTAGRIVFFPDGSSTGGKITLRGDSNTVVVTVDWLTGAVRVERTADGARR
jgi:general secretion pathway protein H